MRVSPTAAAATTLRAGIRSGMGPASTVMPRSIPFRTVTAPSRSVTSAPTRRSRRSTAWSPWEERRDRPSTVMPRQETAPAQRKKAALDQSPSTRQSRGRWKRWPPGMDQTWPVRCQRMPLSARASSVMAT